MSKGNARFDSVTFPSLLALLFIGLKLGNVISWSWWWVLSPLWIAFAVGVLAALAVLVLIKR
jgi:hypothetical protein